MEMVSIGEKTLFGYFVFVMKSSDYVKNLCSGEDGGLARCSESRPSKAQPSHQVPLDCLLKSHLDCNQYFS